ncbi:MAG TPA: hypothetical protein PLF04_09900 [Candidatus Fermentibacter daniensis]|nr:MAG: hypothetical protein AO395_02585 [Candidatus Fermentibacter daniensis]KZD17728.1 MAG: hypothetical protein AO394_04790 [Candidatus Fermentibacter daniensis]HOZ18624.1 hypothetical protein [Candidatus Fermentibacter daniensis]HPH40526.1 hypothetical protein [Candidatus Fermentibacter daniensis]
MSGKRLFAVSFAYPPLPAAMSIVTWRLLRHCGRDFSVVTGEDGRPDDPGLMPLAATGALRILPVPFREAAARVLARRILYRSPLSQLLQIPDIYRPWAAPAARALLSMNPSAGDVLVTFASPMSAHLSGLEAVQRVPGLRWAAYFGDPWVTNPMIRRIATAKYLHARLERSVVESADLLIFPCSEMRDLTLAGYPARIFRKARVVAHGWEESLYPRIVPRRSGGPFVVRHLGSLYGSRSPSDLVSALPMLLERSPAVLERLRFEFYGSLQKDVDLSGLPQGLVEFLPQVPYPDSLALMASADALLVITPSEMESGAFLPSKLIDYVGAGRPVIGICRPGACTSLIERLGGWVCGTGSPGSIAESLASLCNYLESEPGNLEMWGDPEVRASLRAEETGRIFGGFLEELF